MDPGVSGGLACLDDDGTVVAVYPMPATEIEILTILGAWAHGDKTSAMLEGVHSSPQMGVVSAFTFGAGYGYLRCALDAAGIAWQTVYPVKWQNALRCRSGGNKNITKAAAQARWPSVKVTHKLADALLIAEYGRLTHRRTR